MQPSSTRASPGRARSASWTAPRTADAIRHFSPGTRKAHKARPARQARQDLRGRPALEVNRGRRARLAQMARQVRQELKGPPGRKAYPERKASPAPREKRGRRDRRAPTQRRPGGHSWPWAARSSGAADSNPPPQTQHRPFTSWCGTRTSKGARPSLRPLRRNLQVRSPSATRRRSPFGVLMGLPAEPRASTSPRSAHPEIYFRAHVIRGRDPATGAEMPACVGCGVARVLVASWGSGRVALDMPADRCLADERGVGLSGSCRGVAHKRGVRVL